MHDRRPIRALADEGVPIRAIARQLGVSRNTVRRALDPARPDRYLRASRREELEGAVRAQLQEFPEMPASWLAYQVGWSGSLSHFCVMVRRLRREVAQEPRSNPLIRPLNW